MEECAQDAPWVFGVEAADRDTRDRLRHHMAALGVETRNYFYPLHLQPVNFLHGTATYETVLPEAEALWSKGFYIPSHWYLSDDDVSYVVCCLACFFTGVDPPVPHREPGWVAAEREKPVDGY